MSLFRSLFVCASVDEMTLRLSHIRTTQKIVWESKMVVSHDVGSFVVLFSVVSWLVRVVVGCNRSGEISGSMIECYQ